MDFPSNIGLNWAMLASLIQCIEGLYLFIKMRSNAV